MSYIYLLSLSDISCKKANEKERRRMQTTVSKSRRSMDLPQEHERRKTTAKYKDKPKEVFLEFRLCQVSSSEFAKESCSLSILKNALCIFGSNKSHK